MLSDLSCYTLHFALAVVEGVMTVNALVIYLSEYNGLSSSAKRMLGLVKGLVEKNFEVTLLTTEFKNRATDEETNKMLQKVQVISIESNMYSSGSQLGKGDYKKKIRQIAGSLYRLVCIFGHTERIAKNVKINILPYQEYDFAISISDPKTSHIALKSLLKQGLTCKKIIEYWGDPLYGDITFKSIYPSSHIRDIEKKMLILADSIVYTSPFTVKREQEIFPELSLKMKYVPTASAKRIFNQGKKDDSFVVGYYGAYHSGVRNIMPLYNTFADNKSGDAILNIIGDSNLKLESRDNILVRPRGNISQYECDTDVLVCILNRTGTQIPGKLYYNASTNKAVLVILDGDEISEMRRFLASFDRFYVCENSEEEIARTIEKIRNSHKCWNPCELLQTDVVANMVLED